MGAANRCLIGLNRIRSSVSTARGWRAVLIALGAGALSALAFAPFFLSPILFIALPVLVWLTDEQTDKGGANGSDRPRLALSRSLLARGAWFGWWFGIGIHTAGLYWIGNAFLVQADAFAWLLPFAMVLLPAGLALFTALAIAVFATIQGAPVFRVLALATVLGASEWLRGTILTGFPWNVLGYALTQPLELMQFTSVVGIYGLTMLSVLIFATPLAVLARATDLSQPAARLAVVSRIGLLTVCPLLAMWLTGAWLLAQPMPEDDASVRLIVVQPSIKQRDKFDPQKWQRILEDHISLTQAQFQAKARDGQSIDVVIWPEAAMPFLAMRAPNVIARIAELVPEKTYLVTGLLRAEQDALRPSDRLKVFNSAVVFNADGKPIYIYDKYHLVPFGEYLPFQETLEAIGLEQLTRQRGGFSTGPAGGRHTTLPGLGRALFMICYEAIFPKYGTWQRVRPQLLINLTNDAWFGVSSGPYQHFHQSRVRAVEQGIPLLRAANNGISGIIDARGRIRQSAGINTVGVVVGSLPQPITPTIYSKFGDFFALIVFVMLVMALFIISCKFKTLTE